MTDISESKTDGFIDRVSVADLQKAVDSTGGTREDQGSQRLRQEEQTYIRNWRKVRGDEQQEGEPKNLIGLALSGGGIRSATFSLGVMQALAHHGLLKKVDYLSTVSGGGYIGSALAWLLSREAQQGHSKGKSEGENGADAAPTFGVDKENFPFGADDPAPDAERKVSVKQGRMLRYLRDHGYYLSPGKGITLVSLIAVVLRGTILNLLVWLPIFVLFFLFGIWLFGHLGEAGYTKTPILSSVFETLKPETTCSTPIPENIATTPPAADAMCTYLSKLFGFELFLWITSLIVVVLLLGVIAYSILTWFRRDRSDSTRRGWYRKRRTVEKASAVLLPLAVLTLVVGTLPIVAFYLQGWLEATGPVAMLSGMAIAIRHFLKSTASNSALPPGILVSVGAGLFLYGVILVSFQAAFFWFPKLEQYQAIGVILLILLSAITGWFVNLNYISIHRYYRDRLMESYMPDIDPALKNETKAALGADGAYLHEVSKKEHPTGPYHIINTNLVLVNSDKKTYESRGGDNFILSPLYCGSNATGWCSTESFMDGKMTLPTAVAISAAAVNPNTGVGGQGLTRNLFLSLVMSLLNLRVGYWATHPDPKKRGRHPPNHFRPGSYSFGNALGIEELGFTEHRLYLQLTDGGHFENTGVYELVRRRMKLIIVCDGGADPDFSFSDFQTTVRRIEDDFGARLKVDEWATPDDIVPVPEPPECASYPKGAAFADQGYMVGTITYADGTQGKVIYLKTTMTREVSFKVKGYKAQHREFPDESTADQFFDQVQFEAYRELGFRLADQMLMKVIPKKERSDFRAAATLKAYIEKCGAN